jgi:hypothetical protein
MHFDGLLLFRCAQQYFTFDFRNALFIEYTLPFPDVSGIRKIIPGEDQTNFLFREDALDVYERNKLIAQFNFDVVQGSENLIQLKNNKYLVCLEGGYAIIDPKSNYYKKQANTVSCIASFIAWDRSGKPVYNLAGQIIRMPKAIELAPQINRIEFNFASFDFTGNKRFRYQLLGFDPEWSPWTNVSIKNIPT